MPERRIHLQGQRGARGWSQEIRAIRRHPGIARRRRHILRELRPLQVVLGRAPEDHGVQEAGEAHRDPDFLPREPGGGEAAREG